MATLDIETVRHALSVARENGLAEVELCAGEEYFRATLQKQLAPKGATSVTLVADPPLAKIVAPLVGYYRPGRVELTVGASLKVGDIVASIAALGIANDIESTVAGEVVEVLVERDDPVQYGQVLAMVKPK